MDSKLLKATMLLREETVEGICDKLGISRSTWFRKLSGESDFLRGEISRIAGILSLDEAQIIAIFFAKDVSYTKQREVK